MSRTLGEQFKRGQEWAGKVKSKARVRLSSRYRDYSMTFGSEQGQRVLADLCKCAGVFDSGFVQGDPLSMAYKAGQRDFAIQCLNMSGQGKIDIDRRIRELDDVE